ncbi:MAG: hypothetical protein OEZ22_14780 [Spirochaetia bacterium]|nr:hypothetical protein [Spirochaetia bacterium]
MIQYGILISLINLSTCFVIQHNQELGLYPANADSIGIPILGTFFLSILAYLYLILINYLKNKYFYYIIFKPKLYKSIIVLIAFILYLPLIYFASYGLIYWFYPNHYIISATFLIIVIFIFISFFSDTYKLLFYNLALLDKFEIDFFCDLSQDTHGIWEVFEFIKLHFPLLNDHEIFEKGLVYIKKWFQLTLIVISKHPLNPSDIEETDSCLDFINKNKIKIIKYIKNAPSIDITNKGLNNYNLNCEYTKCKAK